MSIEKDLSTSGERLRRARVLAGLSTRKEFEEKYKISANTLQGWEQNKNPLSEKGARRVVEAFKWEGLICSIDWLVKGTGMPPRPYEALNAGVKEPIRQDDFLSELNLREEETIYKETQLFKEKNINSIILAIDDNALEPFYSIGDYIGGSRLFEYNDIKNYVGQFCIIELTNNLIIPRMLHEGSKEGTFTLSAINPKSTVTPLNLYDTKINSAAPILWHRRKLTALHKE